MKVHPGDVLENGHGARWRVVDVAEAAEPAPGDAPGAARVTLAASRPGAAGRSFALPLAQFGIFVLLNGIRRR